MYWWIKARRAHTHVTVATVVFGVLTAMVGNQTVFLPAITTGSTVSARLELFVPVIVTAVLMTCLESRLQAPEVSGTRGIPSLDATLTISVMAVCVALAYAAGQPAAGRNTLFLAGLMLTTRTIIGQAAVMVPIAWLLAVIFVGYRTPSDPYPWTVVPEPANAPHAAGAALVMLAVGLACLLRTARNTP
jgi:hypothetical protein